MKKPLALCTAIVMTVAVAHAHDIIPGRVTWNADVAPIVSARCVSCHKVGASAPMPLITYEQARPWARAIKEAALTRHMPNWRAARGYGDFLDDPSLSPFEVALISAWADGGAPKGTGDPRSPHVATRGSSTPKPELNLTVSCDKAPIPIASGRLMAIRPRLQQGQSVGIGVQDPDGRREIVAWIREYDPRFPTTYWLRKPPHVSGGGVLIVEGATDCSIDLAITGPASRVAP